MDKFVCVRKVQMLGVDLSVFQFHGLQTWAVFFLNADKTIYGRYGTSGVRNSERDVSLPGLKKAMKAALKIHEGYPGNKASLAGKTGPKPLAPTPEKLPAAKKNLRPAEMQKGKGCVHCHQVSDWEYQSVLQSGGEVSDRFLWTYPMPDTLGLFLDPRKRATVRRVASKSSAAKAGFRRGDKIETMNGQPIISIADVQWVLHNAEEPSKISVEVKRRGRTSKLTLELKKGWRRKGGAFERNLTVHWYASAAIAGMVTKELNSGEKARLGIRPSGLALNIERFPPDFVKQKNQSAVQIGLKKNDIIIEVDGKRGRMSDGEFLAWLLQEKGKGSQVSLKYVRGGRLSQATLSLP